MKLQELYNIVLYEMGVTVPNKPRNDDFAVLTFFGIFCRLAKDSGFHSTDIGLFINRDFGTVNWYVRQVVKMEMDNDFISNCVTDKYRAIKDKLKAK